MATLSTDPPISRLRQRMQHYMLAEARIVVESWQHRKTLRPRGSLGYRPPAPEVFIRLCRVGGPAIPTSDAARAGVAAISALTIKMVPPMGPINLTFANGQGQLYPLRRFLAAHPTKT